MMTLAINILITGQVIKHVEHGGALLYISGICFHPNVDAGRLAQAFTAVFQSQSALNAGLNDESGFFVQGRR